MKLPLLPTTMVGSYPRPAWFSYQLEGRDVLEAFKVTHVAEAYADATGAVLRDQEEAGLDVVADRKSTRLNSSHLRQSRMPSSA